MHALINKQLVTSWHFTVMPKTKAFQKTKGGAGADDFKKKRVKLGKRVAKATATDTKCAARFKST
jgi:hypothetical protein